MSAVSKFYFTFRFLNNYKHFYSPLHSLSVPEIFGHQSLELYGRGARKLTRENLKVVLGRVFNYKLGCFAS